MAKNKIKYRIEPLDNLNWVLVGRKKIKILDKKTKKPTGEKKVIETRYGYFPKLEQAAMALLELMAKDKTGRKADISTLGDILFTLEKNQTDIRKIIRKAVRCV